MTISMYQASVGLFVPFLRNLSGILDQAASHAEARRIDPSVLLKMRLFPNMYHFAQQVAEVNRHAVTAGALLAGREPISPPATEPDFAELKARTAASITFVEGLPREQIDL